MGKWKKATITIIGVSFIAITLFYVSKFLTQKISVKNKISITIPSSFNKTTTSSNPSQMKSSLKEFTKTKSEILLKKCSKDFQMATTSLSSQCLLEVQQELSLKEADILKLRTTCEEAGSIEQLKKLATKVSLEIEGDLRSDIVNKDLCQRTLETHFKNILIFYADNLKEIDSYSSQLFFVIYETVDTRISKMQHNGFQGEIQARILNSLLNQSVSFILKTSHLIIRLAIIAEFRKGPLPFNSIEEVLARYPEFLIVKGRYQRLQSNGQLAILMQKMN